VKQGLEPSEGIEMDAVLGDLMMGGRREAENIWIENTPKTHPLI